MNNRVTVARGMVGIFGMQVCAVSDATDEEILEVCNKENPAGTTNGWGTVVRKIEEDTFTTENMLPVQCEKEPDRIHFLVLC